MPSFGAGIFLDNDIYIPKRSDIDTVRELGSFSNDLSRVSIDELHQNPRHWANVC